MAPFAVLSKKARGAAALALVWLFLGLALLAGSAVALYLSSRNEPLAAYSSAPACASFADAVAAKNCRYTATVKVTQVVGDGGVVEVYFDGPSADSPFVRALLPVSDTSPSQGDQVQAEFWQLKVTKLDGMVTADNPASDPEPGTLLVIGLILLPLGAGASAWGIVAARRLGRGLDAQANPGPGMGPLAGSDVLWR